MKRKILLSVVMVAIFVAASHLWAQSQSPEATTGDYVIGPGDVLDISVWNNKDLTRLVTVLPDGKIHFPLIGEIVVGGKTLTVLEKELKKRINTFVPDPNLSVMVHQVKSLQIYVIGKVNRPGRFELNTKVNVLQALAMSGGFNAFAKRNKVKIFREIKGNTKIFEFEYDDLAEGNNLTQNIILKRGDVVVVP